MSAMAGIDQALWDIAGKTLGIPVHQMLGGAVRERHVVVHSRLEGRVERKRGFVLLNRFIGAALILQRVCEIEVRNRPRRS